MVFSTERHNSITKIKKINNTVKRGLRNLKGLRDFRILLCFSINPKSNRFFRTMNSTVINTFNQQFQSLNHATQTI